MNLKCPSCLPKKKKENNNNVHTCYLVVLARAQQQQSSEERIFSFFILCLLVDYVDDGEILNIYSFPFERAGKERGNIMRWNFFDSILKQGEVTINLFIQK